MNRGGWIGSLVDEEAVSLETGVTFTTLRIEDPERRSTPWRPIAIASDQGFRSLAHDVATETDPRATCKLQAEPRRRSHGTRQLTTEAGRLKNDEERLRASGKGGQAAEPLGETGRAVRGGEATTGQVQDQQVHRSPGQQRATDGQTFVQGLRGDDDQPLEADATGCSLDRIEAPSEIDPGHDGAGCLGFRCHPKNERGSTARTITADRNARRPRQSARSDDRIERRKTGSEDPLAGIRRRPRLRCRPRRGRHGRRKGKGAFGDPRSCRSPASLEVRHGCRHVCGKRRHRPVE
jgi:hypothetical protein